MRALMNYPTDCEWMLLHARLSAVTYLCLIE